MTKKISKPNSHQQASNCTSYKYEKILKKIIQHFQSEIPEEIPIVERYELATNAWNIASMYRNYSAEQQFEIIRESTFSEAQQIIMNKMVEYILEKWPDDMLYINSLNVHEDEAKIRIHVTTIEKEEFIANMVVDQFEQGLEKQFEKQMEKDFKKRMMEEEFERQMQKEYKEDFLDFDFKEGFVNRAALQIQALKPFIDWVKYVDPNYISYHNSDKKDNNIYLVHVDEIQLWLKENFNAIFEHELGYHDPNGNNWPSKRTFKMFKKWFSVKISTLIYDLSEAPLYKGF